MSVLACAVQCITYIPKAVQPPPLAMSQLSLSVYRALIWSKNLVLVHTVYQVVSLRNTYGCRQEAFKAKVSYEVLLVTAEGVRKPQWSWLFKQLQPQLRAQTNLRVKGNAATMLVYLALVRIKDWLCSIFFLFVSIFLILLNKYSI